MRALRKTKFLPAQGIEPGTSGSRPGTLSTKLSFLSADTHAHEDEWNSCLCRVKQRITSP